MRFQYPVNRLMTEAVLSVDVSSPVSEALRLFAEYPVHHLPVVREQTLVGMLSSADVMKLDCFLPKNGASRHGYIDQRFSIETLMRHPAISVQPHQPAEDAARLMVTHAIHALPVVDIQDHLLGIITTTDMMQALLFGATRLGEHVDTAQALESIQAKPSADALEVSVEAAREVVGRRVHRHQAHRREQAEGERKGRIEHRDPPAHGPPEFARLDHRLCSIASAPPARERLPMALTPASPFR